LQEQKQKSGRERCDFVMWWHLGLYKNKGGGKIRFLENHLLYLELTTASKKVVFRVALKFVTVQQKLQINR
jgi:hypothetical protein